MSRRSHLHHHLHFFAAATNLCSIFHSIDAFHHPIPKKLQCKFTELPPWISALPHAPNGCQENPEKPPSSSQRVIARHFRAIPRNATPICIIPEISPSSTRKSQISTLSSTPNQIISPTSYIHTSTSIRTRSIPQQWQASSPASKTSSHLCLKSSRVSSPPSSTSSKPRSTPSSPPSPPSSTYSKTSSPRYSIS